MLSLGLDAAGMAAYMRTIGDHHQVRTIVRTLDLAHNPLQELSERFNGGQVDLDCTRDVWTSATLSLYDPAQDSGLVGPDQYTFWAAAKTLVRVFMGVRAPGGDWVDVPAITGIITRAEQNGEYIDIELQDKSELIRRAVHPSRTWSKGTLIVDVVRDVLTMCGESPKYIDLGAATRRISTDATLAAEQDAWKFAYDLANWLGYDGWTTLYYDARGVARVRALSGLNVHVFGEDVDGPGKGMLLAPPEWNLDALNDDFATRVVVTGKTPSGGKAPVGVANAPASYPLAPDNFRRNGVALAWTKHITDDNVTSAADATATAKAALDVSLRYDRMDVSVQSLPLPHLEPWDRIRVQDGATALEALLRKASTPLSGMAAATYGICRDISRERLLK